VYILTFHLSQNKKCLFFTLRNPKLCNIVCT